MLISFGLDVRSIELNLALACCSSMASSLSGNAQPTFKHLRRLSVVPCQTLRSVSRQTSPRMMLDDIVPACCTIMNRGKRNCVYAEKGSGLTELHGASGTQLPHPRLPAPIAPPPSSCFPIAAQRRLHRPSSCTFSPARSFSTHCAMLCSSLPHFQFLMLLLELPLVS